MNQKQLQIGQFMGRGVTVLHHEVANEVAHVLVVIRFHDKGLGMVSSFPEPYPSPDEIKEMEAQLMVEMLNKMATAKPYEIHQFKEETVMEPPQPPLWQRVVRLLNRIGCLLAVGWLLSGCVNASMSACNSGDLGACRVACVDKYERACRIACSGGDAMACFDYAQERQEDIAASRALIGMGAFVATPQENRYGVTGF